MVQTFSKKLSMTGVSGVSSAFFDRLASVRAVDRERKFAFLRDGALRVRLKVLVAGTIAAVVSAVKNSWPVPKSLKSRSPVTLIQPHRDYILVVVIVVVAVFFVVFFVSCNSHKKNHTASRVRNVPLHPNFQTKTVCQLQC